MDRRFLTVLGVSLVFALVVSSVFYQMTARSGSVRKADAADQKDVVVATRPLGVGWMIKPADMKIAKVPLEAFLVQLVGQFLEEVPKLVLALRKLLDFFEVLGNDALQVLGLEFREGRIGLKRGVQLAKDTRIVVETTPRRSAPIKPDAQPAP